GENGRKAISWKQTEIDGLEAAPLDFLAIGAAWSWRGQARSLVDCDERSEIDSHGQGRNDVSAVASGQLTDGHFMQIVLTNGAQSHVATLLEEDDSSQPTLIFDGAMPPRDQEFWIREISESVHSVVFREMPENKIVAFPSPQTSRPTVETAKPRIAVQSAVAAE
ncbi:MAG: hypothetical protein ACR2O2_08470, partial [Ruegeria sp.]